MDFESIEQIFCDFFAKYQWDIFWVFILFFLGKGILRIFVKRVLKALVLLEGEDSGKKRRETLENIILTTGNVVIYLIVIFLVLDMFGVDIRPILAGAGVVGVAVGFGAQTLVKDLISGLFILIENRYDIGDKVIIDGAEGEVVRINMRSTVLKGDDKSIRYISNSSIKEVVNLTQVEI